MAVQINQIPVNNNILDAQEQELVASREMTRLFGLQDDFVQLFIYNNTNTLLNQNLNFQDYTVNSNSNEVIFDPEKNILDYGYRVGTYELSYNFLRPVLTLNSNLDLFLQSISEDRTEIKIASTLVNNETLLDLASNYIAVIQDRDYFIEFYIDFGNNELIPASSLAVEVDSNGNTLVLVKLFDPLSDEIQLNFPLNVVEKIVDTQAFQAILTTDIVEPTFPSLRQANFSIDVDNKRIGSSDYHTYNTITQNSGSNQIINYISQSLPQINIDHTEYENFIHFSSATQRLETFKYKLGKLQSYETYLSTLPTNNLDYITTQNQINEILENFDGYENYLYYESSSKSWPKTNSVKPYINDTTGSTDSITWYNLQYTTASYYDEFNSDNLVYGLPVYIQEKEDFENVKPFVQSVGNLFDDIWLYIKSFTDLWKAENKLTEGISKDLVSLALESLGISLYTDGDQDDLNLWLNGMNSDGTFTFQTSSFEKGIDTVVTASQYTLSGQDEAKSIFKRIYHNLPTLLKSRGSNKFINYLNTLYGTPETILYSQEYGGVDKSSDSVEFSYDKFSYSLKQPVGSTVSYTNPTDIDSFEVRFYPSQSSINQSIVTSDDLEVLLIQEDSGSYPFGKLQLSYTSFTPVSTDLLPFYVTSSNGELNWWNVYLRADGNNLILDVQSKKDTELHFTASATITSFTNPVISAGETVYIGNSTSQTFEGKFQEIRGWTEQLSSSVLRDHTLNPQSYVGNTTSSAYENLLYQFPLGNDLNTYNHTTLTSITGSQPKENTVTLDFTGPFTDDSYVSHTEQYNSLPAIGGYSTPVTNKIRVKTDRLATNRLQPGKSIIYNPATDIRTLDTHLIQTGLSPQDQINNDIIAQLGDSYNLDDIIGDPTLSSSPSYNKLKKLREDYFKKYERIYNYKDFVRLINVFQKSLWRYISESVPGRSTEATGIVIKPHILERSKVQRHEPVLSLHDYSGSIDTAFITGSNPGEYCCSRNSPLNEAFYTGEFSGSTIDMSRYPGENYFKDDKCKCIQYDVTSTTTSGVNAINYINCKGESINSYVIGPKGEFKQITACSGSIINNLGSNNINELKTLTFDDEKRPVYYEEQYRGYNALENNVTSSVNSAYKEKLEYTTSELKGPCYRQTLSDAGGAPASINYSDCQRDNKLVTIPSLGSETIYTSNPIKIGILPIGISAGIPTLLYKQYYKRNTFLSPLEFPDSYETETAFRRSRYDGVKTTSKNFNQSILTGSIPGVNLGNTNAEKNQTFIAFADWAGNSLAENFGTSNFHIKYLIDESGSVFKPEFSSSYYYNTEQNFGSDSVVNISQYDGEGNIGQDYKTTIYRPLKRFNVIAHSDSGSKGNVLNSTTLPFMGFETTTYDAAPDINLSPDINGYFLDSPGGNNVLTSSLAFGNLYSQSIYINQYAQKVQGEGYSNPLPLEFKKYDQFRVNFVTQPSEFYTIISSSIEPTPDFPYLYIYLDREYPSRQTDSWAINRLVDDPGFITIYNDPNRIIQTGRAPAFIIPKYISDELRDNIPNIIDNLTEKRLI